MQQGRNQNPFYRGSTRRNADQYLLPLISTDTTDLNAVDKFLRGLARI